MLQWKARLMALLAVAAVVAAALGFADARYDSFNW